MEGEQWAESITGQLVEHYRGHKEHKFVVHVVLLQRDEQSGVGFRTYAEALWDASKDECVSIRWENNSIRAVVTVWRIAF